MTVPTFQAIAQQLAAQAAQASHTIRIDDALLGRSDVDAAIVLDLRRPQGDLLLVVDPADIPASPPNTGFTLPVTVPPSPAAAFLGLMGRIGTLAFQPAGGQVGFVLSIQTGGWTPGDGFAELAGLPFNGFGYAHPVLTFASDAASATPAGVGFAAGLTLTGPLGLVQQLISGQSSGDGLAIAGAIAPSADGLAMTLASDLGVPKLPIGPGPMLELEGLSLVVDYAVATGKGARSDVALRSAVKVQNSDNTAIEVAVRAVLPLDAELTVVQFVVEPTDALNTTIGNLLAMVAGQSWGNFLTGPAAPLKQLLDTFGFERFVLKFDVGSMSPVAFQLEAGTLHPWTVPVVEKPLTLTMEWYSLIGIASTAQFTALLELTDKLSFELSISLPDLTILGAQHGEVDLTLNDLTGGKLDIPDDLLAVSFRDFSLLIDQPNKTYTVQGVAGFSFTLFDTQILALTDAAIAVVTSPAPTGAGAGAGVNYVATLDGTLALGPIRLAVQTTVSNAQDCVLSAHLVNETVGSMLTHFVHLVDPTYDISLPDPWNALLDISLDAFTLDANLTKKTVGLTYAPPSPIDLVFLQIDSISLFYSRTPTASGASAVRISIDGSFLGQRFSTASGNPLSWDALNDSPPAVPGKGSKLFDLDYVGLGQHVALAGADLTNMGKVMTALRQSVVPIQAGQLPPFGQAGGISFSAKSSWLIGAQFTVADTVALSAIFNDPDLYGILLKLSGEKAKIFAGLQFEILYRKVTDSIGVYHIEFTLPDAMRHLEFGEVSITLPVLILDIYTNGNFRVNLGFPVGLDFSNSFSVQVFPFVGFGGFYFALLDGATSSRVPVITNGSFSPVIEFGLALSIGVGKTVNEGILSGGISVTVVGILQGVLGWFEPTDTSPKEVYYWVQGSISVVGKLYATIDFAIIQASVDVTAYLTVTLTVESHQPILISATASVSVRVGIKVVFFTIHLSFSARVDASFTIGSASATPWKLASPGTGRQLKAGPALLRAQRTLHAPRTSDALRMRATRRAALAAAPPPPITQWPASCVLPGGKQTVSIWAMPTFTKSQATAGATDAVVLLAAGNSIAPAAATPRALRMLAGADASSAPFNLLAEAMLRWAVAVATGGAGDVTADQIAALGVQLTQDATVAAAFNYGTLTAFLAENFTFAVTPAADQPSAAVAAAPTGAVRAGGTVTITTASPHGLATGDTAAVAGIADASFDASATVTVTGPSTFTYPQQGAPDAGSGGGTATRTTGVAIFPMIPEIRLTDTIGTDVSFASYNLVDLAYQDKVRAYFRLLQVQYDRRTGDGATPAAVAAADPASGSVSIATLIFSRYFNMLMSATVKAAADLMAAYPVRLAKAAGLADLDAMLGTDLVATPLQVVSPNQDLPVLAPGATLPLPDVVHQARAGDTFATIADALQPGAFNKEGTRFAAPDLVGANAAASGILNTGTASWAVSAVARTGGTTTVTTTVPHGLAAQAPVTLSGTGNPSLDGSYLVLSASGSEFTFAQPGSPDATATGGSAATPLGLVLTGLTYVTQAGDTPGLLAMRLLLRIAGPAVFAGIAGLADAARALMELNPGVPASGPDAVIDPRLAYPPAGTPPVLTLPGGGSYTLVTGDTYTLVAAYGLAQAQGALNTAAFLLATAALNPSLPTDPAAPLIAGTTVTLPPVFRPLRAGDSPASLAQNMVAPFAAIQAALAGAPAGLPLLAPQAVLRAPITYAVQAEDTFAKIAQRFDLTLADVADAATASAGLFAAGQTVTIANLPKIAVDLLVGAPATKDAPATGLLGQAEWNNISGMVSRFLLSGLRLPVPDASGVHALTVEELGDPARLGAIATAPLFALTGQQYAFSGAPADYRLTLANPGGAAWLTVPAAFALTAGEIALAQAVAATPLDPQMQAPQRLSLFAMLPGGYPLQNHIAWQSATPPPGPLAGGGATQNPSVWLFPDTLAAALSAGAGAEQLYELVAKKNNVADQAAAGTQVGSYCWATIVDLAITLPVTDGPSPSVANCYVLEGADDAGAATLRAVAAAVTAAEAEAEAAAKATGKVAGSVASLHLLYPPNASVDPPSGLLSDAVDDARTFLVKSNLSTLANRQQAAARPANARFATDAATDPEVLAAGLDDAGAFLTLAWEASITRSGGFYLNYVDASDGGGLPAAIFDGGSRATVSLLVLLDGQLTDRNAPVLPFNNCAVVGDNIDTGVATLAVQPVTLTVPAAGIDAPPPAPNSLAAMAAAFTAAYGGTITAAQLAALNADVPLLLVAGASIMLPDKSAHVIGYNETLAGIAAAAGTDAATLVGADTSTNAIAGVLSPGALVQFSPGVLRPVTTVPAGTVGFEITRANPDPQNLPWGQLSAAATVGTLFNLVGYAVQAGGGFIASGAGLPTTPSNSLDGDTDDQVLPQWYYRQTLAVSPFAQAANGSMSPALPPAAANPYNGVGFDAGQNRVNQVAIGLQLQDIYGNAQPIAAPGDRVTVPVGYYDTVIPLGSWPSVGVSYAAAGSPLTIALTMTMQQARYVPGPAVPVASALAAIGADLTTYRAIYYQLCQPDIGAALTTTLDSGAAHALPVSTFRNFANAAYVYLAALNTLGAVTATAGADATVGGLADGYGVTATALLEANASALCSALFPAASPPQVPAIHTALAGDTLDAVVAAAAQRGIVLDVAALATLNAAVPLAPGAELAAPATTVTVTTVAASPAGAVRTGGSAAITTVQPHGLAVGDAADIAGAGDASFNGSWPVTAVTGATGFACAQPDLPDAASGGGTVGNTPAALAARAGCSVVALAAANATTPDLLVTGTWLSWGTRSYQLVDHDTLANAAAQLGTTAMALAASSQAMPGLFVPGVSLAVNTVLATGAATLAALAAARGTTVAALVALGANPALPDLFAAGTPLVLGRLASPPTPEADDTLAAYARSQGVSLEQFASANIQTGLVPGAALAIPATLANSSAVPQYCTYLATAATTLSGIAGLFGTSPAAVAALNPDLAGLINSGRTITDPTSGKAVTTEGGDTFALILARFAAAGVQLTLDQLAAAVADQSGLLAGSAFWICPPMTGAAGGRNAAGTLSGLADAYGIDPLVLATANAAVLGLVTPGKALTVNGATFTTGANDTLNALVVRAAAAGTSTDLAGVVAAVAAVAGLIVPAARVLPVPPGLVGCDPVAVTPAFPDSIFPINVTVTLSRDPRWIDPDFTSDPAVAAGTFAVPPLLDGGVGTIALGDFARALEQALPGLRVATGGAADGAERGSVWGVNLGNAAGRAIGYQFNGADACFFAMPPLSTSVVTGAVPILPYVSGEGLGSVAQVRNFQSVDLDLWLNAFLTAVDQFLSPAYAVPAFLLAPDAVEAVVKDKRKLAQALSQRVKHILATQTGGSLDDARGAMLQAMLNRLSSATTVSAVVQVPVTVESAATDPAIAPRLSGKAVQTGNAAGTPPSAYSLSNATVALADGAANATFLFSVKAAAEHKNVALQLQYAVSALAIPDATAGTDGYRGASWLTFVNPVEDGRSAIGEIVIPVPLRAYPPPVSLLGQSAAQTVAAPTGPADLVRWTYRFSYQHADAEQDVARVAFDLVTPDMPGGGALPTGFAALAQFSAVWPALGDDLAMLTRSAPGAGGTAGTVAAIAAFRAVVDAVAKAFAPMVAGLAEDAPKPQIYQLDRVSKDDALVSLSILSVDQEGVPTPNGRSWPAVWVHGPTGVTPLAASGTPTSTKADYLYPADPVINAGTAWPQYYLFGEGQSATGPAPDLPAAPFGLQMFEVRNPDIFVRSSEHASVSIIRNLALIDGADTDPDFVYQTPFAGFTGKALAAVTARAPIALRNGADDTLAQALARFLTALFAGVDWAPHATVPIRLSASYAYPVAGDATDPLIVTVPVLLVPSEALDPTSNWSDPASFVGQIAAAMAAWSSSNASGANGAMYLFDLTVFDGGEQNRPLISAPDLQFTL